MWGLRTVTALTLTVRVSVPYSFQTFRPQLIGGSLKLRLGIGEKGFLLQPEIVAAVRAAATAILDKITP